MTPLLLVGAGVAALAVGLLLLRSLGPGYRVGRLLAATPTVGIEDAIQLADAAEPRYVAVSGRIDSKTDFEDEHHRPLVFRRVRLQARRARPGSGGGFGREIRWRFGLAAGRAFGRGWETFDERRQAVDFEVGDALAAIGVDHEALRDGLVVIPRESVGLASDLEGTLPVDLAPGTPVRMTVEQVSSVEHAIVVGAPRRTADGLTRMTAGPGRPLILTTLERDEAMRILAGGRRLRVGGAAAALGASVGFIVGGLAWLVIETVA